METIGATVSFAGSIWALGYEEVPASNPDLGVSNQDGYMLNLLRDGKVVFQTNFIKGQTAQGTVESQANLFITGVNRWLAIYAIPAPPPVLSEWKQTCLTFFLRFAFKIVGDVLSVELEA
jgi:hypothetical protein